MHDPAHIDIAILGARPKAIAALLRYFRDLDTAEEAFQEACLRALQTWPHKGPPRDPTAWLIVVGRNAALDTKSRVRSIGPVPNADALADAGDDLTPERLDESHYGDDILRLLFVCGHPTLPATQQIALALRIVSGLTVEQIAKAFLVSVAAMEQRITRARRAIAALEMIDPLRSELDAYFYLHGLRGALLKELNRLVEARDVLNRAIALANSVAEAKLIRRELDSLAIA